MKNWREKWALITGASAGIGVALAEELASGGTKLVLTARRRDRLEELARRLAETYKISTEVFPADLADASALERIFAFTKQKGIEIDLLINNAGFGQYGEFHSVEKQIKSFRGSVSRNIGDGLERSGRGENEYVAAVALDHFRQI